MGFGEDPDVMGPGSLGVKRKVSTTITNFSAEGLEFFAGGGMRDSCQGDSGGPAFVTLPDGSKLLAGITSRGSNPCGDGGFYGAPYPALCWIREETGIDLLDGSCSECDCVSTEPAEDEVREGARKGCRIGATDDFPRGSGALALGLLMLGALRRRR